MAALKISYTMSGPYSTHRHTPSRGDRAASRERFAGILCSPHPLLLGNRPGQRRRGEQHSHSHPAVTWGADSPLGKVHLHRKSRGPSEAPTHGSEQRTKQFRAICSVSKFAQAFAYLCKNRLSPCEELSPYYLLRDCRSTAQGSTISRCSSLIICVKIFFSNGDYQLYNENWLQGSRQLRLI